MTNSQLFKAAHAMAKQVHVKGESYQVTFGACLKAIKAEMVQAEAVKAAEAFNFVALVIVVLTIAQPLSAIYEAAKLVGCIVLFLLNPFCLMIWNGLYLNFIA